MHGMKLEELRTLQDLLRRQRLLSLAVVVSGEPVAGLLPFLAAPDLSALVVHASALARHTAGLGEARSWAATVAQPDIPERDALQTPRVLLEGHSRAIQDPAVLAALRRAWVEHYPSASATLELPDFTFFSLDIERGRLITGFARALNLTSEHLREAAAAG